MNYGGSNSGQLGNHPPTTNTTKGNNPRHVNVRFWRKTPFGLLFGRKKKRLLFDDDIYDDDTLTSTLQRNTKSIIRLMTGQGPSNPLPVDFTCKETGEAKYISLFLVDFISLKHKRFLS